MRDPLDDRLGELLLRYLESALSEQDSRVLDHLLLTDQNARKAFQDFCAQDFSLAELFNMKLIGDQPRPAVPEPAPFNQSPTGRVPAGVKASGRDTPS